MDIADTITPNSEQLNAEDLLVGPRTYTVTGVEKGTSEQPVFIHLAEVTGRTYRPGKSMRRVLAACWGTEASNYVGRRMTLFNDPTVMWAGKPVGGIRIRALSHIPEPVEINLTVTRGKRVPFTVQPIHTDVAEHLAALTAATTLEELQAAWVAADRAGVASDVDVTALKDARKVELAPKQEGTES